MQYTCPMHPEVVQEKPGMCPKCGMSLVPKDTVKLTLNDKGLGPLTWKSYVPLIVIIGLILAVTTTLSIEDYAGGVFSYADAISYFMAGFFIVFAGFKLIDLKGFAQGYLTYDLLAKNFFAYGYIYPFIELSFGLMMIINYHSPTLLWTEFGVMAFSGIGVAVKLARREKFQCVCLGTFLKVPLTKITVIEDFGMALLALILLFSI